MVFRIKITAVRSILTKITVIWAIQTNRPIMISVDHNTSVPLMLNLPVTITYTT